MVSALKWVIKFIGNAKAREATQEQAEDTYAVLRNMSHLSNPLNYSVGGDIKPLGGPLSGWSSWKPSAFKRRFKRNDIRIVVRTTNGEIQCVSFGPRKDVYSHAVRNIGHQRKKGNL